MLYNCPFCHHENAALYRSGQVLRDGRLRDIFECGECQALYPRPRMDENEIEEFHSKLYINEKYSLGDLAIIARQKTLLFRKLLSPKGSDLNIMALIRSNMEPKGNALDIGAFTGRFVFILKFLGFNAYGLEKDKGAAMFAREKGLDVFFSSFPENISADLSQVKFSLITVMETIYYFSDLKKSLTKINEMLLPGGFILVKYHQGKSKYYKGDKNSYFKRYGDNVQGIPTLTSVKYWLQKTGFEVHYNIVGTSPRSFLLDNINVPSFLKKILNNIGNLCSKIQDSLNMENADQLIVLARKVR